MAISHWPLRQARPKESVTITAGWPGSAARSAGREASGSSGSRISVSGAPALEASTPALAQTKPCSVRQIRRPASARTSSAVSDRTTSTWRGSLPCSAASASARGPGRDVGEAHDPALGLGHDLVRDREHVAGRELAGGRGQQRRQIVPRPDLRQARERVQLKQPRLPRAARA